MLTATDRKVLACLSGGPRKAAQVGRECFAPVGVLPLRQQNHYTLVAGGHLRRLEKMGLARRIRTGLPPSERTTWAVVAASEGELF